MNPFHGCLLRARPTVLPGNFQRPLLHRNVLPRYFQKLARRVSWSSDYIVMLHVSGRLLHGVSDGRISLFFFMFVHVEGTREGSSLCAEHSIFQRGLWCSCRCRHLRKTSTRSYRSFCYRKPTKSCKHAKQASQAMIFDASPWSPLVLEFGGQTHHPFRRQRQCLCVSDAL